MTEVFPSIGDVGRDPGDLQTCGGRIAIVGSLTAESEDHVCTTSQSLATSSQLTVQSSVRVRCSHTR